MIIEFAQALSSIKTITDLTSLIVKTSVDSTVTQKAIELQSSIIALQTAMMSIQAQNQELLAENEHLKKQINCDEEWKATSGNYMLKEVAPSIFIYILKPDKDSDYSRQWFCPHCFERKQRSFLQKQEYAVSGRFYRCHNCKLSIVAPEQ